ncbi:LOW QUALITY PROTEIN: RE1-silencing transcription factor-like [Brachionichthys hirsutus]|uniref:LOW QUALITY PROTEIN: RE1-silencing transcription factor-like n=1 Tax=Brachionichthys hirsutus TaxID=412623 RepID=UPI003605249F
MAAQTAPSAGTFPVGVSVSDGGPSPGTPGNALSAPQLVMLANVAAVTAAEGGACGGYGAGGDGSVADEKEMMELKTVGCGYSDSEDDSFIRSTPYCPGRYSYDNQNQREFCIIEYPESPAPPATVVDQEDKVKAEDLIHDAEPRPAASTKTPEQDVKQKGVPAPAPVPAEGTKKKKAFHCKPCRFQAQNEQEFVQHLSSHSIAKMMVVNRVEGRSKDAGTPEGPAGGAADSSGEGPLPLGDAKGLIRCERCGYNTNRYDHYIAHLKHHSKEGNDHRVFKCTLCPYTTVSQYHWRKHLRNHFPSKLHTCIECSYFSDRKSNYIQHIRTHTGVRPFLCLYCDYSSSQKTHLTRHMRTHSGERPFKCESCNYLAANQHEVTRHSRQVHDGPKPLSCPYCEYKTADRSNFKKHVELHLNPRQFLCPLCKYAASKKCNLKYHIKSRHSGCDVAMDISKVKLRIKKPGLDGAEENATAGRSDSSSNVEEDFDVDEDIKDPGVESIPINLSFRNAGLPVPSDAPDEVHKKANGTASEKDNVPKGKELDKKVTARQKKTEKVQEDTSVKAVKAETATVGRPDKAKRRARRTPAERKRAEDKPNPEDGDGPEDQEKFRPDKENKSLNKPRRSGSKKSLKSPGPAQEAAQKPEEWIKKEKAAKRKPVAVLDLDLDPSKESSSQTPSKAKRQKTTAPEKLLLKPRPEDSEKVHDAPPTAHRANETAPAKEEKKTRSGNKKAKVDPVSVKSPPTGSPGGSARLDQAPQRTNPERQRPENLSPKEASTGEDTPPPPAPPAQQDKPADPEDDEGIHSSHEGGSDISDSSSEGSEDSGLNSAASGKMANDPETPTEEIPTPPALKSHTCIFCDRTFPLEEAYRRHLNRHLVNVYYMDQTADNQAQT